MNDLAYHFSAHHLPQADLIMVLGDNGQVAKQGSYAQLRDNIDGFVQMNDTQSTPADEVKGSDKHTDVLADLPTPTQDTSSVSFKNGSRKTTDLAVYKYYFSALGWSRIAALILFIVTDAGMSGFRCKL
jgi:ATP-binding cassette subfamily C (CFTR/MRP) protein 1